MENLPADRRYTREHEWARTEDGLVRVGITAYAVRQLGDITLVELPRCGARLVAGDRFGDIESVKTVSELFAPISGEIVDVNSQLEDAPEVVNQGPYEGGWMILMRPDDSESVDGLMSVEAYQQHIEGLER